MISTDANQREGLKQPIGSPGFSFSSLFKFFTVFAVVLVAAEFLLHSARWLNPAVATLLVERGFSYAVAQVGVSIAISVLTLLGIVGIFIFVEWRQLKFTNFLERYRSGILFSVVALVISMTLQAIEFSLFNRLGLKPLVSAETLGPVLVILPLIYILALGLLEYWLHRALHHYEFLWRFHAVHHQIEHLNAAQSYSHFGEKFIYLLVITTPLVLLVEAPQTHIALVTTFYIVSNQYMHSDSKSLSFPAPLRHIFADNVYHHYHHVRDARYFGKNYASFLSFYDRIFGTQYMPQKEEFPVTGIEGYKPIETLRDYIQRPFVDGRTSR